MEPFKNLLGYEAAKKIARALKREHQQFSEDLFLKKLPEELEPLELKQRMQALKNRLLFQLPENPKRSFPLLLGALKQDEQDKIGLAGFLVWPISQIVAEKGLEHFALSMDCLKEITKVFTSEFAVRPFFLREEEKTLKQFQLWTKDANEHVRRLVSEGSRPLLPWGQKLPAFAKDPKKTIPLLEALKYDEAKYVQKSVANHWNDHAKNHPELTAKTLLAWSKDKEKSVQWISRHGARTLIKKGHPKALQLLGVRSGDFHFAIKLKKTRIRLGENLALEISLHNKENREAKFLVDIKLGLKGKTEKTREKVFKGKELLLSPKEQRNVSIEIPIKAVTTRRYYAGTQYVCALVNGKSGKPIPFHLTL